jgi:hypothetical protein
MRLISSTNFCVGLGLVVADLPDGISSQPLQNSDLLAEMNYCQI